MKLSFFARRLKPNSQIKTYLIKKLTKLEKILPETARLNVELRKETRRRKGRNCIVNFTLFVPGEKPIHLARARASFEESIDILKDGLEKKIIQWRRKRLGLRKRDRLKVLTKKMVLWLPERVILPRLAKKRGRKQIEKKVLVLEKPMTAPEALERLKLQKENFYPFINATNNKLSIIFKNKKAIKILEIHQQ